MKQLGHNFSPEKVEIAFSILDTNHSNFVDFDEFMIFSAKSS
jgi:Ca2+-binding EF-hand superfamily protein